MLFSNPSFKRDALRRPLIQTLGAAALYDIQPRLHCPLGLVVTAAGVGISPFPRQCYLGRYAANTVTFPAIHANRFVVTA